MINHNDHIDRRAMLEAERAALVGANEEADAWGAAVGARSERIKGIDRALLAIRTKEPDYIAQTFEPEHVAERDSMYAWFDAQGAEARKIGCTFPRYSRSEDGMGLLFEAWKVRPFDQGEPRWHLEPAVPTEEQG